MKNKSENKVNILSLVSALCWGLAIMSAFVAFNEYQSLQKTKAYVTAAQKSKAAIIEAETTQIIQETEQAIAQTTEQGNTINFVNENVEKNDTAEPVQGAKTYVINKNSKKIHSPNCQYANSMKEENKLVVEIDNLEDYINRGYTICSKCGAK